MNELALARVLAKARGEAPAEPAAPPGPTPAPEPKPAAPAPATGRPPVPIVDAGNPRAALHWHLDTWARMNEAEWTREEVNALYNAILAFWTDYPDAAKGWWREWRAAHPEARLC